MIESLVCRACVCKKKWRGLSYKPLRDIAKERYALTQKQNALAVLG